MSWIFVIGILYSKHYKLFVNGNKCIKYKTKIFHWNSSLLLLPVLIVHFAVQRPLVIMAFLQNKLLHCKIYPRYRYHSHSISWQESSFFPDFGDRGNINITSILTSISISGFNISHYPSWRESSSSHWSQWWRRIGEGRGSPPHTQSSQSCGSASPAIWTLNVKCWGLDIWYLGIKFHLYVQAPELPPVPQDCGQTYWRGSLCLRQKGEMELLEIGPSQPKKIKITFNAIFPRFVHIQAS